jgi:hypothetical protein
MKKPFIYSLIILVFGLALGAAATPKYGVMTFYNILGTVTGIKDHPSAGRQLVFYRDVNTDGTVSDYNIATIEADGSFKVSASANLNILPLKVGSVTYHVAVVKDAAGYGAGPVDFKLSGLGFEAGKTMTIALGAGVVLGGSELIEPAPAIQLWFNNRLYQPKLVTADTPFIVTEQPKLKVNVTIQDRYALPGDLGAYSIVVDSGTSGSRTLDLKAATTSKVLAAETTPEKLKSMSLEYAITEALAGGKHNFLVTARSAGTLGTASVASQTATVEVITGPVRLIGTPITFPSPFSIDKDKTVTIQYTLSKNAAIEIILSDISGRRIKTFVCDPGTEGGSAGLNKVSWNGKTDLGPFAGNGIYVGLIVAKDEGRKLGSVKVSLLD